MAFREPSPRPVLTHPKLKTLLNSDLAPAMRKVVEAANEADKYFRCGGSHSNGWVLTPSNTIDSALAGLLKLGVTEVEGMPVDVWLLRFLRDHKQACVNQRADKEGVVAPPIYAYQAESA